MEKQVFYSCLIIMCHVLYTETCPLEPSTGHLNLSGKNLTYINSSVFEQDYDCGRNISQVKSIDISNNNIRDIDKNSFVKFIELQTLNISKNSIKSIHKDTFTSLKNLLELDLSFNSLTLLEAGLISLLSLRKVWFNNNNITHVEPGIVGKINVGLEYFNMNYNNLRYFDLWPYETYQSYQVRFAREFHLQHNQIESITNHMNWTYDLKFPYEVEVYLQFNRVKTVSFDTLRQFKPELKVENMFAFFLTLQANLSNNPFLCDCNMHNLAYAVRNGILAYVRVEEFRYRCAEPMSVIGWDVLHEVSLNSLVCNVTGDTCPSGCFCQDRPHNDSFLVDCTSAGLTEMPENIPKNGRSKIEIILDKNNIKSLKNTSYLTQIYTLSLDGNNIEQLDTEILKNLNTSYLNIQNNKITSIPEVIRKFSYRSVKLGGNPLRCDCDSLWIADWIKLDDAEDRSLTCEADNGVHALVDISLKLLECTKYTLIIVFVCLSVVLVLIGIGAVFAKLCPYETKVIIHKVSLGLIRPGKKYEVDSDTNKEVDIYAVFDDKCPDVIGWFRYFTKKLNKKKPIYSILNPARFMEPGSESEMIQKWIGRSKRVLVILSENIFENGWRIEEIEDAERRSVEAITLKNNQKTQKTHCVVNMDENSKETDLTMDDVENANANNDVYLENAPKIIYIIYNNSELLKTQLGKQEWKMRLGLDIKRENKDENLQDGGEKPRDWREKIQQEPWKSRLAGQVVLNPDDKLFWSKLRYELPSTGRGTGDGNFMPFTREAFEDDTEIHGARGRNIKLETDEAKQHNFIGIDKIRNNNNNEVPPQNKRLQNMSVRNYERQFESIADNSTNSSRPLRGIQNQITLTDILTKEMKNIENSRGNSCENSRRNACENSRGISCENSHGNSCENSRGNACENSHGNSCEYSHGNSCENSRGNSCENSRGNACAKTYTPTSIFKNNTPVHFISCENDDDNKFKRLKNTLKFSRTMRK